MKILLNTLKGTRDILDCIAKILSAAVLFIPIILICFIDILIEKLDNEK